jgi:hypothetical protein
LQALAWAIPDSPRGRTRGHRQRPQKGSRTWLCLGSPEKTAGLANFVLSLGIQNDNWKKYFPCVFIFIAGFIDLNCHYEKPDQATDQRSERKTF